MTVLSDTSITAAIEEGRLGIEPFDPECVEPCSVDLRLGNHFHVFRTDNEDPIDVKDLPDDLVDVLEVADGDFILLEPGAFVLAPTLERITVSDDVMGMLDGKSSLGRLGVHVHATAGVVDAGFSGRLTLDLSNVAGRPIKLYPGMRIAQIVLFDLSTKAARPYGTPALGSKYQGAEDVMGSQFDRNFVDGKPV